MSACDITALVLYHARCPDGMAAAWAVWKKLGDRAEYYPVSYNEPCPADVSDRAVFLVDFCYKREQMREIARAAVKVHVLDHHKSAYLDTKGLDAELAAEGVALELRFDLDRSGARLAWDHFHGGVAVPLFVRYVEDRDLWKFSLPYSREISALVMSYPKTLAAYDQLAERFRFIEEADGRSMPDEFDPLVREGVGAWRYQRLVVEELAAAFEWVELGGHTVRMARAPFLQSEVAGRLAEGSPFGLTYLIRPNGVRQYSLRVASGDFDVSELAKRFGGGGHARAAGFEVQLGEPDPVVSAGKQ